MRLISFVRASTLTRSMLTTPGSNIGKNNKTYEKYENIWKNIWNYFLLFFVMLFILVEWLPIRALVLAEDHMSKIRLETQHDLLSGLHFCKARTNLKCFTSSCTTGHCQILQNRLLQPVPYCSGSLSRLHVAFPKWSEKFLLYPAAWRPGPHGIQHEEPDQKKVFLEIWWNICIYI